MLSSWFGRTEKKRPAVKGAKANRFTFTLESLEDRVVPALRIWTGLAIVDAGGLGAFSGPAAWSNGRNWDTGAPVNGDSVLFPVLTGGAKPLATANPFMWPTNSVIDYNVTIENFTILDDHYHIDGPSAAFVAARPGTPSPVTLTITGSITSRINKPVGALSGVSLLGNFVGPALMSISLPNSIQLNAGETVVGSGVAATGVLEISAPIGQSAAAVGLNKIGPGTMTLSGPNTFTGTVNVNAGTLNVATVAGNTNTAAANPLGTSANGTVVQPGATLGTSVGTYFDALTISGTGAGGIGALAQITRPLATFSNPSVVQSGASTWQGNITLASSAAIGSVGNNLLSVTGTITSSGVFDLTKVGGGTLSLQSANTYLGNTLVSAGVLDLQNNNALNNAFGKTTVADGGAISITGDLTISERLELNGTGLFDNNGNPRGALRQISAGIGSNWTGTVTLLSATSIGAVLGANLMISGPLVGTFDMRKVDNGTLTLPNANNGFSGNTVISDGVLIMLNAQALGPATAAGGPNPGGSVSVTSRPGPNAGAITTGTLQVVGSFTVQKSLTLEGNGFNNAGSLRILDQNATTGSNVIWGAGITLGSATSMLIQGLSSLDVQGVIDSPVAGTAASLNKLNAGAGGTGVLTLSNQNTYTGTTVLEAGLTVIKTGTSLGGAGGNGTTVSAGSTLRFDGALSLQEDLVLSGTGIVQGGVNQGALQVTTGVNTVVGTVTLLGIGTTEADINVAGGASLTFNGSIGGDADLRKLGAGDLVLAGSTDNTYVSNTFIDDGTLVLAKTGGATAILGPIFVGDGIGADNSDTLRLAGSDQIADQRPGNVPLIVTVNRTGQFLLNGFNETVGGLTLQGGTVTTGAGTLTLAGDVMTIASTEQSIISGQLSLGTADRTFDVADAPGTPIDLLINALISGSGGLIKANGAGTMQLTNPGNNYSGDTTINAGVLQLGADNTLPAGTDLTITATGALDTLGRSVSVASLTGNGTLTLGAGRLTVGSGNTDTTFSGVIGATGAGGITKVGTGTLTLSDNTGTSATNYTGPTTVSGGTLNVTGDFGGTTVTVQAGVAGGTATLGGTGSTGNVIVGAGGRIAPGVNGTGTLETGPVTFGGGTFAVDVAKTGATTTNDLLNIAGALTGGATNPILLLSAAGYFNPTVGETFTILRATGAGIPAGFRFNRPDGTLLDQGQEIVINGRAFTINYDTVADEVRLTFVGLRAGGTFTVSSNPSSPGNVTITVTFTPAVAGDPIPQGMVTFTDSLGGTFTPPSIMLDVNGQATVTGTFNTIGIHNVTATISGSGNGYDGSVATFQQRVALGSTTTVTASTSTANSGSDVTFTATVTGTAGTPTGTVSFVNVATGQVVGTATLDASGKATFTTSNLGVGANQIRAVYSGDNTYVGSTSDVTVTVNATTSGPGGLTGASVIGGVLVLFGANGQPVALFPVPAGTQAFFADLNGDGKGDVLAILPDGGVLLFDGATGNLVLFGADVTGDGRPELFVFSPTTGALQSVILGTGQVIPLA